MSEIRNRALTVLNELPAAYVRLHLAITAPRRKRGAGVRTSGGTRDFTPINVEADAYKTTLLLTVTSVHQLVSERFSEIGTSSFNTAVDDLRRWSDIWTRMTDADELVIKLEKTLHRANRIVGLAEGPQELPQSVCPSCLQLGGMRLHSGNGHDERYVCEKCATSWTPGEYSAAVTAALASAS